MVFPDLKTIDVRTDVVTIRSELDDAERVVHMDVASHRGASYTNQGHSIGRWDGKALVVDTDHFTARVNGNSFKLASSREKHLTERFELNDESTALIYHFEVEDPVYFSQPVSGEIDWVYTPSRRFAARGCDPEGARRYLESD
jgi:hypothetical protein